MSSLYGAYNRIKDMVTNMWFNDLMRMPMIFGPSKNVVLGKFSIEPKSIIMLTKDGSGHQVHSAEVLSESKDELDQWVMFHSFITNSEEMSNYYENSNAFKIEEVETDRRGLINADYDDFLKVIYFRIKPSDIPKLSYAELYEKFKGASKLQKGLVNSLLINYGSLESKNTIRGQTRLYFNIAKNYTIIERLLSKPVKCTNILNCTVCGSKDMEHYIDEPTANVLSNLEKVMEGSGWLDYYARLISAARNKVRHKVFHGSIMPIVTYASFNGDSIDYNDELIVNGLKKDLHALRALDVALNSITWNLLMNDVFGLGLFQKPNGYGVRTITLKRKTE